jgi:TolB-like protein/DNA-binding winged helix-turn-helix (wHTH) protein/Tfp pilus assembly protein PilF
MTSQVPRRVRFGVFEADLRTGDLRKQGAPVRLRGRPFDVLALLLERPGDLVTREELQSRLWPADTFVDFDHGLNTSVNRLREALGDSADNPRFVETVPRKGYRFIAPVTDVDARATAEAMTPAPEKPLPAASAAAPTPVSRAPGRPRAWLAVATAFAVVMAAGIALFLGSRPPTQSARPPRLAVLPFRNVSGDPGEEYFADGLTDVLIADLAQIGGLRVISRTSIMPYKATAKRLPEIAKELDADTMVEGSVLRAGSRVRITARVVDAASDRNLWSETYERDMNDILALQREVTRAIALGVRVTTTPQEQARLEQPVQVDPRAYEAFLRGRLLWQTMTDNGLLKGVEYMNQAIAIDPSYAPAYSGLAYCWWILGGAGFEHAPPTETAPKAKAAALRALELDPSLSSAQATLAMVEIDYDWNFTQGEARMREVIARSPSLSDAHVSFSAYLAVTGRADEAIAEARRGLELDPLSIVAGQTLGWRLLYGRQYDRAIIQFRKTLELDPRAFVARIGLAEAHWGDGDHKRGLAEAQQAYADSAQSSWVLAWLGYAWAASGQPAKGQDVLAKLADAGKGRYVSPVYPAMVETGLGERDRALASLEEAFRQRSGWMLFLDVEPAFDALRGDPRFVGLLRRVGLGSQRSTSSTP